MTKKQSKLSLGKSLRIEDSQKLYKRLCTCANKKVDVLINAEKASLLDITGLQLIIAFIKQVHKDGNDVEWHKPSDTLLDIAALTGLSEQLVLVKNK